MSQVIDIRLDLKSKQFKRDLDSTSSKLKSFGGKVAKIGAGIGVGLFAAFQAVDPLISAASDLSEEVSKSDQIFGNGADAIQAFAKTAAAAAGLSEKSALQFANQFAQFGKAAGLEGAELAGFATELVTLQSDLSSFNNISMEEAGQKLLSGLAGEAEPLRQLGVFLGDEVMRGMAAQMGLGGEDGALSEQEKVLARMGVIFAQTSDAQGDFARTSDGLANQQRILQARFENIKAELGEKLLPIMVEVVTWLNESFIPALADFAGWLETNVPAAVERFEGIWKPAWENIKSTAILALEAIRVAIALFEGDWEDLGSSLRVSWATTWDWLTSYFNMNIGIILRAFGGFINTLLTGLFGFKDKVVGIFADAGTWLWDAGSRIITGLWDGMKAKWGEVTGWLGGLGGKIIDLKGPPQADSVMLVNNGELIMSGLAMGMQRGFARMVQPTLSGITRTIPTNVNRAPAAAAVQAPPVYVILDPKDIARAAASGSQALGGVPFKVRNER